MNKIILPIKGMHCRSCEELVAEKLKEIPEIKNVQVSFNKKQALIYSRTPLSDAVLAHAVREAGYDVGSDNKPYISSNWADYRDLIIALVLLLTFYFIARKFGLFKFSVGSSGNPSSLLVVLVVGLTAGISTCMALVGGLVLGLAARHSEKHPEATSLQKFRPHLYFNLGRIFSYFLLGGLIGLIGSAFQLSGTTLGLLTIVVGMVMLTLGLQLTEIFPRLSSGGLTLPTSISRMLGIKRHHEKEYSHKNSVLVGALTFFLPCGFTQAMQLYAMSTGKFWTGALIMGTFAVGTAPGLLGIGGLTSVIKGVFAKRFFKFAGLLVIFLAVFNISNGFNLTGWKLPSGSAGSASADLPKVENGYQIVRMTQSSSGYSPNNFSVLIDVPVKWLINSTDSRSCASSIISSDLAVRKALKTGENIIEFTPTKLGEMRFSCSMGMYRGVFKVIEKSGTSGNETKDKVAENPVPTNPTPTSAKKTPASSYDDSTPFPGGGTDIQVIKTTFYEASYPDRTDIKPNDFMVKADQPVRFEISAEADGTGCMSTIMIPGLVNDPELLEKGKTITFNFTPTKKGTYDITCAMGVSRGTLRVV